MLAIAHSSARSAFVAVGLALALLVSSAAPADAAKAPPPGLGTFMEALGFVESGGRYTARNPVSGAYGKYQIMPSNWPAWAARYLGDRKARPTPRNQDRVAAGRLTDLYRSYGSWQRTAYWWLTGKSGPRRTWSSYAIRYVDRVMKGYRSRLASPGTASNRILDDGSSAIRWTGAWRQAHHAGYAGGGVRYATKAGASATVDFTGRAVRVIGPTGPTRGKVQVLVDGQLVRTVDLRSARFHPRTTIFAVSWPQAGPHQVELRVAGSAGRPFVAIDRIVIGR
ncbi:MAG TPA: hypothetical protein VES19_15590 [Candidatus Limnocylindrales bacterium]|nr:hypothetical protein [Candidatus Limnocylindrales bacterium]